MSTTNVACNYGPGIVLWQGGSSPGGDPSAPIQSTNPIIAYGPASTAASYRSAGAVPPTTPPTNAGFVITAIDSNLWTYISENCPQLVGAPGIGPLWEVTE
jgi:hypothetical protein